MIETSMRTWDSVEVGGVESVFCCGSSDKEDTDKIKYFDVGNGLFDIGKKTVASLEWALKNKEFDYIARTNASCYCDKKNLIKYVQALPETNVFASAPVTVGKDEEPWCWGGASFVISKDVVKGIVDNKTLWRNDLMEDMSMSYIVNKLKVPYTQGKSGSIDKTEDGWHCISYGGETISFKEFNEIKRLNHHFYRVKCDGNRAQDEFVMRELFKVLN